ncbi:hypothetical protein HK405_000628, partial [Cladochytrium tenue]
MEDLLLIYIKDLCSRALKSAAPGTRLKVSHFLHALRRDPNKLARVHQLLAADAELTRAKQIMNLDDEVRGAADGGGGGGGDEGLALPGGA